MRVVPIDKICIIYVIYIQSDELCFFHLWENIAVNI